MPLQSIRSASLLAVLFIGAATFPASLRAQQSADGRGSAAAPVSTASLGTRADSVHAGVASGPRIAPAGITNSVATSVPDPVRPIADTRRSDNTNVVMMGIGAAAVGLGLIVGGNGGTVIAATGGVVGLVALYRYLR